MWKIVTRGIRETFERRACRTNVYSQTSQDNTNEVKTNLTCQQKLFAPACITWNKGFCGSAKSAGAKDKEHGYKWDTKHSWPEAIGWVNTLSRHKCFNFHCNIYDMKCCSVMCLSNTEISLSYH